VIYVYSKFQLDQLIHSSILCLQVYGFRLVITYKTLFISVRSVYGYWSRLVEMTLLVNRYYIRLVQMHFKLCLIS